MSSTSSSDYYLSQKGKLLKQLDKTISRVRSNLAARYGEAEADEIQQQILIEFVYCLQNLSVFHIQ